jgi:hypothetical protein
MLQSAISAWIHGPRVLLVLYSCVALPMLAVHFRARSPFVIWLRSLWVAVPLTVVGVLIVVLAGSLLSHVGVTGEGIFSGLLSLGFLAILGHVCGEGMANWPDSNSVYRRGAVVSDPKITSGRQRMWRSGRDGKGASDPKTPITLAGIPVAAEDETKHFKCVGTTGTGKTTAIREMLSAALARSLPIRTGATSAIFTIRTAAT